MSNNFIDPSNQYPPAPLPKIFALIGGEQIPSKKDIKHLVALAGKEADFIERRNEHGRLVVRRRVKDEARKYALGQGPPPTQSPDVAEKTAEIIVTQLREAREEWFDSEARPFLITLHQQMVERVRAALAAIVQIHQQEAAALGLEYRPPPVVRSVERTLSYFEADLHTLSKEQHVRYEMRHQLFPKLELSLEPSAVAAESH